MRRFDPITVPLDGTNLIEASAGTGKTHAITDLYVRLLLERRLSVGQMLVVTFTNAATAELRARVRRRLRAALSRFETVDDCGDEFLDRLVVNRRAEGALDQDRAQLMVALHTFDEAAIFTIHGFCQRMLRENAFESGVPFDAELITNEGPLLADVVQDFWVRELHAAPQSFVQHLKAKKVNHKLLEQLAFRIVTHPEMSILPERHNLAVGTDSEPANADELTADWLGARRLRLQLDAVEYARRELRRRKELLRLESFDDLLHRLAVALRGDHGATLADLIRDRFRVALIDEFQDTDPVQYDIFHRVYGATDSALFLIGDPKQAIYAFRGADVFAYMQAKRDARARLHTLRTNCRSDPALIGAVNRLFQRIEEPFVFDEIDFLPAEAAQRASDRLMGAVSGEPPLQILFVPRTGQQGTSGALTKGRTEPWLRRAVAAEIVRFLTSGPMIGERPVEPGDIAVLCRKNKQAAQMQEELRALGVPTVLQTEASVFEAPEADEMERVLVALSDPGDAGAIRAALATSLLGQDAEDLHVLEQEEHRWDEWVRRFQDWHDVWVRRSFVTAFRALLDSQDVQRRLLALIDGERRLTNVLHLVELLHTASTEERRGPHALLHWLSQMRTDVEARAALGGEAAQIRLENDAAAVKLTTVHKSKGLEYPIVYCPFLWDGLLLQPVDKKLPRFHDPHDRNRLKLDVGSEQHRAHVVRADYEAFAENLRLLYVALTRARHRCAIVWGPFRDAEKSALGYVLHQLPERSGDLRAITTKRIKSFIKSRDDRAMRADLEAIARSAPGCIAVTDLSLESVERYTPEVAEPHELQCRTATRSASKSWRTSSFSALSASETTISEPAGEGLDHDATLTTAPEQVLPDMSQPVTLHEFPTGPRAGQLVHEVLERLDFQVSDPYVIRDGVTSTLARFGFEERWADALCGALPEMLATPLGESGEPFCLRDVSASQRLNELEFILPVADKRGVESHGGTSPALLEAEHLGEVFAQYATAAVPSVYPEHLGCLDFPPLAGFLRGFIDLAFEHRGRWYVVDYKSNFLGPSHDDYQSPSVLNAMIGHHYFLQYHLYVVALHRYLGVRVPTYDYDRHFGGVYYLFLRGMAPHYPTRTGTFFDRPSREMIEGLSAAIAGQHAEAA